MGQDASRAPKCFRLLRRIKTIRFHKYYYRKEKKLKTKIPFTLTSTPHNHSDIHTHSHRHSSSHTSVLKRLPSTLTHLFHSYNLPTHSHLAGSLQPCTGTLTFCPVS